MKFELFCINKLFINIFIRTGVQASFFISSNHVVHYKIMYVKNARKNVDLLTQNKR